MTATIQDLSLQVGDTVLSSDDHKVGTLKAFDANILTVEHGRLMKSNFYIPTAAINTASPGTVYLAVTRDAVGANGWDTPPFLDTDAGAPPLNP